MRIRSSVIDVHCSEHAEAVFGLNMENMEIMEIMESTMRRMSVAESPRDSHG
jgi:hypothetical protein